MGKALVSRVKFFGGSRFDTGGRGQMSEDFLKVDRSF